jgi:hypothetical protein
LVAFAITVAFGDVSTSAFVDGARTVADAASVERTHAVVHVVTDAVGIRIRHTRPSTFTKRVELVAITVAVAFWDVSTSALVNLTWAVAHAASVQRANAVVHVVTDAVGISICITVTTARAQGVNLVAVTVAVAFRDVRTSALVDGARPVADAALVDIADAVVNVVTNAIGILVCHAVTTTDA